MEETRRVETSPGRFLLFPLWGTRVGTHTTEVHTRMTPGCSPRYRASTAFTTKLSSSGRRALMGKRERPAPPVDGTPSNARNGHAKREHPAITKVPTTKDIDDFAEMKRRQKNTSEITQRKRGRKQQPKRRTRGEPRVSGVSRRCFVFRAGAFSKRGAFSKYTAVGFFGVEHLRPT